MFWPEVSKEIGRQMALDVSDRELKKSFRELSAGAEALFSCPVLTSQSLRAARLLLFYAVECGLKCAFLTRKQLTRFDGTLRDCFGHDLCKLQKELRMGSIMNLPMNITFLSLGKTSRSGAIKELQEAWRYGLGCQNPTDEECQEKLLAVLQWIKKELS